MVKEHKFKLCREVFTTASEIAGHIRYHKSAKYREEVEASYEPLVEKTHPPFPIAGQRNERQAQGGSGYAGSNMQPPFCFPLQTRGEFTRLASPLSDELRNLYLSQPSSNLNPASCSAPAEGSQFKSDKLRVPQDYPVISSADSLRLQPHDPRPQGSDLDSGLSLDVHHGGNVKPVDTYRPPGKPRKAVILEPPQKCPVLSSHVDNLRFSPRRKIRRVENFEDLFRNDTEKFQQEEDSVLIDFPSDSIQNSIWDDSLQFQQQRDHYLQHSSSHGLQNVVRRGAQPFQQLDLISPFSERVLTDLKDVLNEHTGGLNDILNGDSKQFKQPQDHDFLHSSYDFQPAADLLQQAAPGKVDMFPYLTGGLNDIFENGSPIFERERDQKFEEEMDQYLNLDKICEEAEHDDLSPQPVTS